MGDSVESELLRANRAFYEAFADHDIEAMDALWARSAPVACIHPGWPALHGREEVMWSWRAILLGSAAPAIRCEREQVFLVGETGYVTCVERFGSDTLAATNFFVREEGLWQLVHHHSGPMEELPEAGEPGERLN